MRDLFIHIVSKGAKSNTYKFALAKFLLDYSKTQTEEKESYIISFNEIAVKFLEYYWFQECKYKLKQDFNKEKMPVVIRIIQKHCGTKYISDSYEKYFKDKKELKATLILEIEKKCFKNVIPRFQPKDQYDYYEILGKEHILLKREALYFFKEEYEVLSKILVLEWAKFLEKTNFTPRLISKIELMKDPKRSSLTKYRRLLTEIDNRCFYCECSLEYETIHIDHFIPWSYIYEDEIWNLVPSCSKCNLLKSDSLAPKECLEKIIARNDQNELSTWKSNLCDYYENCYKAGFQRLYKEEFKCE